MTDRFVCTTAMIGLSMLLISGCARNLSSTSYNTQTVGSASAVYPCTVMSSRVVNIEAENTNAGMLTGAVLGGALGNTIGQGKGRVVSTALGGVLGGYAGSKVQEQVNAQQGLEYMVKLADGSMRSVIQGLDVRLNPGQNAHLIIDPKGRSRLVAV